MIKKIFKIIGIILLVLVVAAFAVPYFFKDTIKAKIESTINENVDAKVSFSDVDLSLFRNFPGASVTVTKLAIINKAPFEGDTLVAFEELNLKMSLKELFKGDKEPMNIEGINSKNGIINIIFNKDGIGNFDIALKNKKEEEKNEADSSPISFKIQEYAVSNFKFSYFDERSKVKLVLDSIEHKGNGDFGAEQLDLKTSTTTKVSLTMDKANYLRNVAFSLDATLGINLKQSKYTFKENRAKINELPLEFDGFIQMLEKNQLYDITFKTPISSFKNFLGLIPAQYASNLKDVETRGDFVVKGFVKGELTDTTIPKFNLSIASNNASFKYKTLPKSVENIHIDTKIINETGLINDTYVNLDKLSFRIDQDVFNAKANVRNIAENALVKADLKGTINLGNLTKAYPVELDKPLSGIVNADVTTAFDMQSVEKSDYAKIQNSGIVEVSGFKYTDETGKSMQIAMAAMEFNPSRIHLKQFKATTGKSDLSVNGVLENFYGFVFKNQELKGNFNLSSNQLAVNDFMTSAEPKKETTSKQKEALKIPAFLNCSLTAKANTVLYDNLTLKNVSGKLLIQDQKVTLIGGKTSIFGGAIAFDGTVSTKEKTPIFNMDLGLNTVDIAQTVTQLDMLQKIAPIAGVINGKLNSKIKLSGSLNPTELTPNLNTLTGDLFGQLLSTTINDKNSTVLNALDDKLNFIDLKKLNLNDLKAAMTFKDGKVNVKPFDIKYQDIKVNIGGSHGFDQNMNYNLKLDVPAKYLGAEANNLIAKLTPADAKKLENVPVNAILNGSFKNPKVTTDLKQATSSLVNNLVKQQKQNLTNKGKDALNSIITNTSKPKSDSTKTDTKTNVKNTANDLIKGIFGGKKKKEEPKNSE